MQHVLDASVDQQLVTNLFRSMPIVRRMVLIWSEGASTIKLQAADACDAKI